MKAVVTAMLEQLLAEMPGKICHNGPSVTVHYTRS